MHLVQDAEALLRLLRLRKAFDDGRVDDLSTGVSGSPETTDTYCKDLTLRAQDKG